MLRLYPKIWPLFRLARVEAEALVYRYGAEGVEAARQRERMALSGSLAERVHAWMVRVLAERSHALLAGLDTASRYEVLTAWEARPGQMMGQFDSTNARGAFGESPWECWCGKERGNWQTRHEVGWRAMGKHPYPPASLIVTSNQRHAMERLRKG